MERAKTQEIDAGPSGFDVIGDIHGHADELTSLLQKLGYRPGAQSWHHPEGRKVIFLGDFIDRGPKIREVLETVRGMVDAGDALAILGNHEINAMRFHTLGSDGEYLRARNAKNTRQHQATLDQFPDRDELSQWINWFAGLPLSLDLGGLRAVHACWHGDAIAELAAAGRMEGETLEYFSRKGTPGYDTISRIINGPEVLLPEGLMSKTADGTMIPEMRVKWWIELDGKNCREAIFPDNPEMPEVPLTDSPTTDYSPDAPPTFFGHYALKDPLPAPILPNLACLDYGTGKGGFLCAYRWDGERAIDSGKFIATRQL